MSELKSTAPNRYYNMGWWDGFGNTTIGIVDVPQQYMHHYDDGYYAGMLQRKKEQMIKLLQSKT